MENEYGCETCYDGSGKTVDVKRFISKLDGYFMVDDLSSADKLIADWAAEARLSGDDRGLLSIMNEGLGFYRRTGDYEKAMDCIDEVAALIEKTGVQRKVSGATVYVNMATTMKAFGKAQESLKYYDMAESVYLDGNMSESYEYSALLNNRASALTELERYDEAELNLVIAIEILKKDQKHLGEVAVALINLAHLTYDRNDNDTDKVEKLLDEAWGYLTDERIPHDGNYAFIISKCAPSLRYFNRVDEADALDAVAKVIYGKQ